MSVFLAIETSSNVPAVALSVDGVVVFNSATRPDPTPNAELGAMVAEALQVGNAAARDLTAVGVDTGPGGLGAVRGGVAFANALTYGLGIPVKGFNFFEIAGRQLAGRTDAAVLGTVPAAGENVYLGLYRNGVVERARFGEPKDIAGAFSDVTEALVAGRVRAKAADWLPDCRVHDSGVEAPNPATILTLLQGLSIEALGTWVQAEPLTDTSDFFRVGRSC
jgi:tRNA threonylcarbamoyl adenosine modification protein YeaZ